MMQLWKLIEMAISLYIIINNNDILTGNGDIRYQPINMNTNKIRHDYLDTDQ